MLMIEVKIYPSAKKQMIALDHAGMLKMYIKEPPEKGKANKALIALLSKALGISQASIEIMSGLTSRKKRLRITTEKTYDELLQSLGLERLQQHALF